MNCRSTESVQPLAWPAQLVWLVTAGFSLAAGCTRCGRGANLLLGMLAIPFLMLVLVALGFEVHGWLIGSR